MGRFSRVRPPVLAYTEPLFAVAIRLPNGELKLCNMTPATRELAELYADGYRRFEPLTGIVAHICPVTVSVDDSDIPGIPAQVMLQPSGDVAHEGPDDECAAIVAEFNRLCEAEPTGETAVVVAKGGGL